jgi:hypothetical protein
LFGLSNFIRNDKQFIFRNNKKLDTHEVFIIFFDIPKITFSAVNEFSFPLVLTPISSPMPALCQFPRSMNCVSRIGRRWLMSTLKAFCMALPAALPLFRKKGSGHFVNIVQQQLIALYLTWWSMLHEICHACHFRGFTPGSRR